MNHPACETLGRQFMAGSRFKPRLDSLEVSVRYEWGDASTTGQNCAVRISGARSHVTLEAVAGRNDIRGSKICYEQSMYSPKNQPGNGIHHSFFFFFFVSQVEARGRVKTQKHTRQETRGVEEGSTK